jgi:hypothetical protein
MDLVECTTSPLVCRYAVRLLLWPLSWSDSQSRLKRVYAKAPAVYDLTRRLLKQIRLLAARSVGSPKGRVGAKAMEDSLAQSPYLRLSHITLAAWGYYL